MHASDCCRVHNDGEEDFCCVQRMLCMNEQTWDEKGTTTLMKISLKEFCRYRNKILIYFQPSFSLLNEIFNFQLRIIISFQAFLHVFFVLFAVGQTIKGRISVQLGWMEVDNRISMIFPFFLLKCEKKNFFFTQSNEEIWNF